MCGLMTPNQLIVPLLLLSSAGLVATKQGCRQQADPSFAFMGGSTSATPARNVLYGIADGAPLHSTPWHARQTYADVSTYNWTQAPSFITPVGPAATAGFTDPSNTLQPPPPAATAGGVTGVVLTPFYPPAAETSLLHALGGEQLPVIGNLGAAANVLPPVTRTFQPRPSGITTAPIRPLYAASWLNTPWQGDGQIPGIDTTRTFNAQFPPPPPNNTPPGKGNTPPFGVGGPPSFPPGGAGGGQPPPSGGGGGPPFPPGSGGPPFPPGGGGPPFPPGGGGPPFPSGGGGPPFPSGGGGPPFPSGGGGPPFPPGGGQPFPQAGYSATSVGRDYFESEMRKLQQQLRDIRDTCPAQRDTRNQAPKFQPRKQGAAAYLVETEDLLGDEEDLVTPDAVGEVFASEVRRQRAPPVSKLKFARISEVERGQDAFVNDGAPQTWEWKPTMEEEEEPRSHLVNILEGRHIMERIGWENLDHWGQAMISGPRR
ncbi:hypothetical protein B0H11DRAFT_1919884 [Mycena galericulata]|nr:hypothetical protein B0H11DRAFT_1919884 [Mycena galericulata]